MNLDIKPLIYPMSLKQPIIVMGSVASTIITGVFLADSVSQNNLIKSKIDHCVEWSVRENDDLKRCMEAAFPTSFVTAHKKQIK